MEIVCRSALARVSNITSFVVTVQVFFLYNPIANSELSFPFTCLQQRGKNKAFINLVYENGWRDGTEKKWSISLH